MGATICLLIKWFSAFACHLQLFTQKQTILREISEEKKLIHSIWSLFLLNTNKMLEYIWYALRAHTLSGGWYIELRQTYDRCYKAYTLAARFCLHNLRAMQYCSSCYKWQQSSSAAALQLHYSGPAAITQIKQATNGAQMTIIFTAISSIYLIVPPHIARHHILPCVCMCKSPHGLHACLCGL